MKVHVTERDFFWIEMRKILIGFYAKHGPYPGLEINFQKAQKKEGRSGDKEAASLYITYCLGISEIQ